LVVGSVMGVFLQELKVRESCSVSVVSAVLLVFVELLVSVVRRCVHQGILADINGHEMDERM
jgi:hypothetical protein